MTTIAWDGSTLAVDRQGNRGDMKFPITKMRKLASGVALAWSGEHNAGLALMAWYEAGAKPEDWPKRQTPERFTVLVVALPDGTCGHYEDAPEFIRCEAPFTAWGSGREFAIGAMAAGANAVRAIEITGLHEINTGFGVDSASPRIDLNQATDDDLDETATYVAIGGAHEPLTPWARMRPGETIRTSISDVPPFIATHVYLRLPGGIIVRAMELAAPKNIEGLDTLNLKPFPADGRIITLANIGA